jgi:hypothetical protein
MMQWNLQKRNTKKNTKIIKNKVYEQSQKKKDNKKKFGKLKKEKFYNIQLPQFFH